MAINPQRDPCITVAKLPLTDSGCCTVCQQGTSCTVTNRVESTAGNLQLIQQRNPRAFAKLGDAGMKLTEAMHRAVHKAQASSYAQEN